MSSPGQLLGGIVGGVAGFMFGGPTGALYGAQIGMGVGGVIDPPKGPNLQGPRLSDKTFQTAAYGTTLPRIYGTMAVHGNIFWLEKGQYKEVARKQSSGGKGGGGSTVTSYSYFATFGLSLCDTRQTGPIRGIRRIWSSQGLFYDAGSDDLETIIASNAAAKKFRIYTGTSDQLPDPRMQADLGVDNCPAYRGLAYIVFYDLPLEKFSNTLQATQFKVEVVSAAPEADACPVSKSLANTIPYTIVTGSAGDISVGHDDGTLLVGRIITGGRSVERWTLDGRPIGVVATYLAQDVDIVGVGVRTCTPGRQAKNDPHSFQMSWSGGHLFAHRGVPCPVSGAAYTAQQTCVMGDSMYGYLGGRLYRIRLGEVVHSIDAGGGGQRHMCFSTEGSRIYVQNDGGLWEYDENLTQTGYWNIQLSGFASSNGYQPLCPIGDRLMFGQGGNPAVNGIYRLQDGGSYTVECTGRNYGGRSVMPDGMPIIYDRTRYWHNGEVIDPEAVPLAEIVRRESLLSNVLQSSDLNTAALTQPVRGYSIASVGAIRAALEPLRAAWPFDVVQRGYQLHFIPRGSAPVMTIDAGELDARPAGSAPGVALSISREMDTQLPRRVVVQYADIARNYDIGEESDSRQDTESVNVQSVELPIALSSAEAAGMAEVLLYIRWLQRRDVSFRLPPSYRALEAADVITVTGKWGQYELLLEQVHLLSDGRLECSAKFSAAAIYTPTATGSETIGSDDVLGLAGPSTAVLLDIPRILPQQDISGLPAAMTGVTQHWPGGLLYRTADNGQTWVDLQAWTSPVTLGTARNVLPAGRTDIVDASSSVIVDLMAGELSSISLETLLNGGNLLAFGKPGRWEIIGVQTADPLIDGGYELRDFLRGLYGTEWAAGMHQIGDVLVELADPDLAFIAMDSALIGLERGYRAITSGSAIDSAATFNETYRGVNFKPLSPVYLNGNRHPSTRDWTLLWSRRGRIDAGWRNSVDIPVGEETEAYEIEIFTSSGFTAVARTLTATSPTVAYTSVQQVADFGSNQGTLHVRIYQMSATIGRGYPLQASITRG